ncbi:hypothetical protein AFV9_gp05 [Betalipothrixvirus uzonense]|uniref:Uncharacterized protein n=1 Tax=Betalipothrixvirus uzonense TaxID=512792 RepID=B2CRI2_9VIRU|nr:hypothetical protein AFV9_gp05 [Acidianus filamentous virus 9]ACB37239.1 hypothetical protein [Acidianus filamentous virus 9]
MNEHEEAHQLNELINKGFKISVKLKLGKKEVVSVVAKNGLIITRLDNGMQIIDAPKRFQRREFIIKARYPEPNPVTSTSEIYRYLSTRKELLYREEKVTEIKLVDRQLVIKTEKGKTYILTPSELFEYPIYAW